jgi:hypothetical protein
MRRTIRLASSVMRSISTVISINTRRRARSRTLRRTSVPSKVHDRFVLKGAMLLMLWADQPYRATRDLDFLRLGGGTAEVIRTDVEEICATKVDPDGVMFEPSSIRLEAIRPEDEYAGTRLTLVARCGSARG